MGRPERNDARIGAFHVMNRGAGRRTVFYNAVDGRQFLWLLGEGSARFAVDIHAYALMPNHFHLLVDCPDGNLSSFVQFVVSAYTRGLNERVGSDGPVFRGRFHSLAVADDEYFDRVARYIHRNPIDLSNVARLDGYRWSSYQHYVGRLPSPSWLRTDVVLGFHADVGAYREFVEGQRTGTPSAPLIEWAVRVAIGEHADDAAATPHADRTVLAALWSRSSRDMQRTIESLLAFPTDDARRQALGRARRRLASDITLARTVEAAQRLAA